MYLVLRCDAKTCFSRINDRRVCPKCGAVYNVKLLPPRKNNICDEDQNVLIQRNDQNKTQKRLTVFEQETLPLINFLQKNDKYHVQEIDATLSSEQNFQQLQLLLKK